MYEGIHGAKHNLAGTPGRPFRKYIIPSQNGMRGMIFGPTPHRKPAGTNTPEFVTIPRQVFRGG